MTLNGRRNWALVLVAILAIVITGSLVAATHNDDDDQPITGQAFEDCTKAALAANPGGTVTETEIGDGGAAYGVEIPLANGSQAEVNLDENCKVIGQEADDDDGSDDD